MDSSRPTITAVLGITPMKRARLAVMKPTTSAAPMIHTFSMDQLWSCCRPACFAFFIENSPFFASHERAKNTRARTNASSAPRLRRSLRLADFHPEGGERKVHLPDKGDDRADQGQLRDAKDRDDGPVELHLEQNAEKQPEDQAGRHQHGDRAEQDGK